MGYGGAGHIGVEKETTWGTPVAVGSGQFAYAFSETIPLTIDRFEVKNIVGNRNEPDDVAGLRRIDGEMVFPAYPELLGKVLKGISNSGSVSVVLSGFLWRTDFLTPAADTSTLSPLPSYTLEVFRDVTSADRIAGAVFGRAQFSIQPNQDLRVATGVIAKTSSVIAKTAPTYPGSPEEPFTFESASISIAGGGNPYIEALSWTIDSQIDGVKALDGTNEISFLRARGPQLVNLAGTIGFENYDEKARFTAQSEFALTVNFTKASSFNLTWRFPRVVYTTFPAQMPGRERLTVAFEAKARYHTGSATAWWAALTTTRSAW